MLKKKRILIVDDDKSLLESLTKILQVEGYDIDTAETGREAIEKSKTQFYNLALLDIKLPDIDGTELLKLINDHIPRTSKIIITGYPSTENAIKSLNLEADAYFTKPIDPEKLVETVRKKLKKQEEEDNMTEEKVGKWIETRAQKL
jgi:DNA-binding NtrC family response regulator